MQVSQKYRHVTCSMGHMAARNFRAAGGICTRARTSSLPTCKSQLTFQKCPSVGMQSDWLLAEAYKLRQGPPNQYVSNSITDVAGVHELISCNVLQGAIMPLQGLHAHRFGRLVFIAGLPLGQQPC